MDLISLLPNLLKLPNSTLKKEVCVMLTHLINRNFDDHELLVEYDIHFSLLEIIHEEEDEV